MNRITEAENRLFTTWKDWIEAHDDPGIFVPDGMVEPEEWECAPVKLLFLLKEVNDPGEGFDLRAFLRKGAHGKTWNTVTRWVEGIENLAGGEPPDPAQGIDEERRARALRKIVAMNLKKTPGGGRAYLPDFRAAVCRDRKFIHAQLALYNPDYVICGYTAGLLFGADALRPHRDCGDPMTTAGGERYYLVNGTPHIDWYHPGALVRRDVLDGGLFQALRDIGPLAQDD